MEMEMEMTSSTNIPLKVDIPSKSHKQRLKHDKTKTYRPSKLISKNNLLLSTTTSLDKQENTSSTKRRNSSPGFMKGIFSNLQLLSANSADPFDDIGLGFSRDYRFVPKRIQVELASKSQNVEDNVLDVWDDYFKNCKLRTMPPYDSTLKRMIRAGIPDHYRPLAWFYYSGAFKVWQQNDGSYIWLTCREELDRHCGYNKSTNKILEMISSIDRDIYRTFPDNAYFKPNQETSYSASYNVMSIPFSFGRKGSLKPKSKSRNNSPNTDLTNNSSDNSPTLTDNDSSDSMEQSSSLNISRERNPFLLSLRRILVAFAYYSYPHPDIKMDVKRLLGHRLSYNIGYCQSLNFITGLILLVFGTEPKAMESNEARMETEEKVFWMLVTIVQDKLPQEMYGEKLEGVSIMQEVFWKEMILENGRKYGLSSLAEWLSSKQIIDNDDDQLGYKPVTIDDDDDDDNILNSDIDNNTIDDSDEDEEENYSTLSPNSEILSILEESKNKKNLNKQDLFDLHNHNNDELRIKNQKMRLHRKMIQNKTKMIKSRVKNMRNFPPLTVVTTPWFLTLFINHLPISSVLKVWDNFICQGERVLFRVALTLMKIHQEQLININDPTMAWKYIKEMGNYAVDSSSFSNACFSSRSQKSKRRMSFSRNTSRSNSKSPDRFSINSNQCGISTEEKFSMSSDEGEEVNESIINSNLLFIQDAPFIIGSSLPDNINGVGNISIKTLEAYKEKAILERELRNDVLEQGLINRNDLCMGDYIYQSDSIIAEGDVDTEDHLSESSFDVSSPILTFKKRNVGKSMLSNAVTPEESDDNTLVQSDNDKINYINNTNNNKDDNSYKDYSKVLQKDIESITNIMSDINLNLKEDNSNSIDNNDDNDYKKSDISSDNESKFVDIWNDESLAYDSENSNYADCENEEFYDISFKTTRRRSDSNVSKPSQISISSIKSKRSLSLTNVKNILSIKPTIDSLSPIQDEH